MIKIILLSLLVFYIITIIISYGLILPDEENIIKSKYTDCNKNYIGFGLEIKSLLLSLLLGPLYLYCVFYYVFLTKTEKLHGFRFRRKYVKYYFRK